jgi:hypothetical protein
MEINQGGIMFHRRIHIFPGDVIAIRSEGGYEHHIVYTGVRDRSQQDVIHNDKNGGVQRGYLANLLQGRQWRITRRFEGNVFQREQAVRDALRLEGTQYDILNFNCEHFSSLIQTGRAQSPQLQAVAIIAAVGLGLIFFARTA